MTVVYELDLALTFKGANAVVHFDDSSYHVSSTIQRVDFIVEYDAYHVFLELKDPDTPTAQNTPAFIQKLNSGKLIQSLAGKFRDTLFFRTMQGKTDILVVYLVLLAMRSLDAALLVTKQDELKRSIPIRHADWTRNSTPSCVILNAEQWKAKFGDESIRRISGGAV